MYKKVANFFMILLVGSSFYTSQAVFGPTSSIKIYNKTNQPLYVAQYYHQLLSRNYVLRSSIITILPNQDASMLAIERKIGAIRSLLFSFDNAKLKPKISATDRGDVGATSLSSSLYITIKDGKLKGYGPSEWSSIIAKGAAKIKRGVMAAGRKVVSIPVGAVRAVQAKISETIKQGIRSQYAKWWDTPYKNQVAQVHSGNDISQGERRAKQKRLERSRTLLKKRLGNDPQKVPTIALAISGGGYRAMVMAIGLLVGLEKAGLLDYVTWVCSVSGSTWGVAPLYSYLAKNQGESIETFREKQFRSLSNKGLPSVSPSQFKQISDLFLVEAADDQPFTHVNIFGALLANRLLQIVSDNPQRVYLSEQASLPERGLLPIPIYTAAYAEQSSPQLEWFEYTPWEIGGAWLQQYAPTWAFGRKFDAGKSTNFALEKSLGFHLGTYGAMFGMTFAEAYTNFGKFVPSKIVRNIIEKIVKPVGEKRVGWAEVHNYTKGMPGSKIKDQEFIDLIDAGLIINLPFPPVSGDRTERKVDMFIFYDASLTVENGLHLKKSADYAEQKGIQFPAIQYEGLHTKALSIFKDTQKKNVPVIAYMPRINDKRLHALLDDPSFAAYKPFVKDFDLETCVTKKFCNTMNFKYSYENLMQLSKVVEFTLQAVANQLFDEIELFAKGAV